MSSKNNLDSKEEKTFADQEDKVLCPDCGEEYDTGQATIVNIDSSVFRSCPHCDCLTGVSVVFPIDLIAIVDYAQE